jgi:hypothetical protein
MHATCFIFVFRVAVVQQDVIFSLYKVEHSVMSFVLSRHNHGALM